MPVANCIGEEGRRKSRSSSSRGAKNLEFLFYLWTQCFKISHFTHVIILTISGIKMLVQILMWAHFGKSSSFNPNVSTFWQKRCAFNFQCELILAKNCEFRAHIGKNDGFKLHVSIFWPVSNWAYFGRNRYFDSEMHQNVIFQHLILDKIWRLGILCIFEFWWYIQFG